MQYLIPFRLVTKLTFVVLLLAASAFTLNAQDCVEECECEGGLVEMTLFYLGDANADVRVYGDRDLTQLIDQFAVTTGDDFTVSALGLAGDIFPYYLYFEVDDGVNSCNTRIFSYCPSLIWPLSEEDLEIRGKRYGDLSVYSYSSADGMVTCDLDDQSIEQNWRVGGNLVGPNNNNIGTLNNEDVVFITGNQEQARLTSGGRLGLGTNNPGERLEVDGTGLFRNNGTAARLVGEDQVALTLNPNGGAFNGRLGYLESATSTLSLENNLSNGDLEVSTADDILLSSNAVGIGVGSPDARLHVAGDRLRLSSSGLLSRYLEFNTTSGNQLNSAGADLSINATGGNNIFLNSTFGGGKVAINTTNTVGGYSLYVGGSAIAEEIVVKLEASWPDYVFSPEYKRPDIKEWEQFIAANHHLPGMPSAREMEARDGVAVGETQLLLLEKIEELTLIIIDQQKEIDALKARMEGE